MKTRFIHIGHHRCGSTFIQERMMPLVRNAAPITYRRNNVIQAEIDHLILCAEPYYDAERNHAAIREKAAPLGEICLSFEGFSGMGESLGAGHQITYIPRRLRDAFGPTRILLVLRNQADAIRSRYRADVRYGYLASFETWFRHMAVNERHNWLKYHALITSYAQAFGRENMEVLLFEELFTAAVFEDLARFMGIDPDDAKRIDRKASVNESLTTPVLALTRAVNRIGGSKLTHGVSVGIEPSLGVYNFWRGRVAGPLNSFTRRVGMRPPRLTFDGFDDAVRALYQEDNTRLSDWLGRDLRALGYP